jgi:hypothetical protein
MMDFVPTQTMDRINALVRANAQDNSNPDVAYWADISDILNRRGCAPVSGRSYGDPHLQSFDGARYSFQTVGEFTLAKSNDGKVEVQTRQKARRDDFSLNTAVAMNVNGDRVAIYAEDAPGGGSTVQVNGQPVSLRGRTHFLPNGGTVRFQTNMYVVDWPTGESVSTRVRRSGTMSFMNVTFNAFPCSNGGYAGLMGNANGVELDDYNTSRGVAPVRMAGVGIGESAEYLEKQRLAYIAREFAEEHRITQSESLFDYPIGTSTFTFTDRSFPRVHRSINDLDEDRRLRARRNCENNGVSGRDLDGCIYDNAYLDLPPSKQHVVDNPAEGIQLTNVDGSIPNTNEKPYKENVKESTRGTIFDNEGNDPDPIKNDPTQRVNDNEQDNSIDSDWEPRKDPIRNSDPDPEPRSKPFKIDFGKKSSGGSGGTRPRTSRPSNPRPAAPRPSNPKPSGGRRF